MKKNVPPTDPQTLDLFASPPPMPRQAAEAQNACAYWDHCPNCGHHLENRGCKYRCPRCHYFMNCSDFD